MTEPNLTPMSKWTRERALLLSAVCMMVGIAGGWSIRGAHNPAATVPAKDAIVLAPAGNGASPASQTPGPARLKEMADAQAAPLLDKLRTDPQNPDLQTSIGNLYYDAQQYPTAVDYYGRALKIRPSDAAVRTDMATAYWYMGNADSAIAEFNQAISDSPNNPNTLFNRGLVKWKGKRDVAGAFADWKNLLAANPNYEGKDKVEQMMAEAKKSAAVKP
jgi:tetratricopeptide (TPR) repeat protein